MKQKEKYHLQQLIEGNKKSFIYFHSAYQAKVYGYSLKLVRNHEVAQEITSDVFVKIWLKRTHLQLNQSISGLIFKITRDYCIDHLRKVAKDAELRKAFIENYWQEIAQLKDHQLFLKEGTEIVEQAIEKLPPKCRQVFQLRYTEGFSNTQIAEKLNISPHTVKNHLQKGNRLIKSYLAKDTDLVFTLIINSVAIILA